MSQISYGTITITDITDIDTIKNWYLATSASSGVTKSTSGWTDTIQQMTSTKQYLWNYEQVLGANNTEISSTDPVIIGRYGQDGQSGTDGNSIVSIDEYYQITNSTTNPGASGWQKNTIVVPTSTNKYLWNYQVINYSKTAAEGTYADARIIGVYGDTGPQGPQGNPGTAGINTATVYLYQRATSAPSKPNGNLTYTFASAEITSGTLGNWKQSIGELSGTDPIWVIAAVASSNGTTDVIASTEWSTQIKLAQNGTNGTNGLNQATVYIYKRATSATAPSATTYTFSDGNFTVPSGWSKTIPASDGNPCYVSSAVAIGNGTTATLTWNTPSVLVEDGTDGISPTVTSTSTGVKIVDAAGNTTYINNGSNGQSYYTHIRYATDSSGSEMSSSPTGKTYIGVYSGTSSTAPTTASSYTWSKYVGDPGASAIQYYAFVKYATDANGTGMQDNPDSTHIYVGTYTGTNASPAASAYKWSKYVGQDGQSATQYYAFVKYATDGNGTNRQDTPDSTHIYVGTYAGTNASPTAGLYEWSKYVGDNGVSVTEVKEVYCLTNGTPPTLIPGTPITSVSTGTGVWTTVVPTYVTGYTYYTSIQTSLSSGTSPIFSTPIQNQGLTTANSNAATAKAATDLLGGYFIYKGSSSGQSTPSGAGIIQQIDDNPGNWGYNTWIGSNGINLRYGETVLSNWGTDSLTFYKPVTSNGVTTVTKGIELDSTNGLVLYKDGTNKGLQLSSAGLEIFGSSQSTADVTVNSSGIKLVKGGLEAGTKNTSDYIYLWSNDDSNHSITIGNSTAKTDWRIIVGNKFGVDKAGNLYASNANIAGTINANTGTIGGSSGWTISSQKIASGGTLGQAGTMYLNTASTSESIAINGEAARTDWMLTIGDKFGVTSDGYLHADGLNITNITAESLNIGPVVKYYVCDTAAATSAKTINNVSNFTLTTGLTINVTFTYGNTSSTPTLNINDTGAISIMAYDGTTLSNSYEYNIAAGSSRTFTYNGTYWLLQDNGAGDAYLRAYNAEDNAYGYITTISGIDGISVRRKWDNTNFVNIRGDGIHIYKTLTGESSPTDVAFFGETARIGAPVNNTSRIEMSSAGFDLIRRLSNSKDNVIAHFGYDYTIGPSSSSGYPYPFYTLGTRNSDYDIGGQSCVIGTNLAADGYGALAEGLNTKASGDGAHAEGFGSGMPSYADYLTIASGDGSHAEGRGSVASGDYSHAEGNVYGQASWSGAVATMAIGVGSHAENQGTRAEGNYTHTSGIRTIAGYQAQFAIGKFNNNKSTNVFEVGWGSSDSTRKNIFEVDTSGNVNIPSGAEYQINGSPHTHTTLTHSSISIQTTSYVSVTIGANSYKAGEVACPTVTNFAPRCIVGWNWNNQTSSQSGETIPFFNRVYVDQTEKKVHFTARNCTGSQITTSARFFILYTQNS